MEAAHIALTLPNLQRWGGRASRQRAGGVTPQIQARREIEPALATLDGGGIGSWGVLLLLWGFCRVLCGVLFGVLFYSHGCNIYRPPLLASYQPTNRIIMIINGMIIINRHCIIDASQTQQPKGYD